MWRQPTSNTNTINMCSHSVSLPEILDILCTRIFSCNSCNFSLSGRNVLQEKYFWKSRPKKGKMLESQKNKKKEEVYKIILLTIEMHCILLSQENRYLVRQNIKDCFSIVPESFHMTCFNIGPHHLLLILSLKSRENSPKNVPLLMTIDSRIQTNHVTWLWRHWKVPCGQEKKNSRKTTQRKNVCWIWDI